MKPKKENDELIIQKRIVKYELEITGRQKIDIGGNMPTFLSVQEQNGKLMMWIQHEENFPGTFNINIDVIETGKPFVTQGKYVGMAILPSGKEFHVFAEFNYIRTDK